MLYDERVLNGRQENTVYGGIIDLLGIAPDSSLVLIELKRDKTLGDVVAQTLDFASWVERLQQQYIAGIFSRISVGKNLSTEFANRFDVALDENNMTASRQIIIVA